MKFPAYFLRTFLPLFLVIVAAGIYIDRQKRENEFENVVEEQERALLLRQAFVFHFFDPLIIDAFYLAHGRAVVNYLNDSSHRHELVEEWRFFEGARKNYRKIRIIGIDGRERLCVNYSGDSAYETPGPLLRDLGRTDYFSESVHLRAGEIYISPPSLSPEPVTGSAHQTPIMRVGMGIFDSRGRRKGVLVANYLLADFLENMESNYVMHNSECSLLDAGGYWLKGPGKYTPFGFMYNDERKQHNFPNLFPEVWKAMQRSESGWVQTGEGLFIFRTVPVFQNPQQSGLRKRDNITVTNPRSWILVAHVKPDTLRAVVNARRPMLGGIVSLLVMLAAALAYLVAANHKKEMRRQEEMIRINNQLRAHEIELEQRTQELIRKNKELEQFAYITSHDLQEPLRMVSSFLQLVEKRLQGKLDETTTQYIHFAVDGAERMKELIQDLLKYSRVGFNPQEQTPVDLKVVLQRVLLILDERIKEAGAKIIMDRLPVVKANSTQMEQLLLNLLENALKYRGERPPVVQIGYEERKDSWLIYVKDNGIGIDPRYFDKIFVIFQRLHNRNEYPGTGIGLAICKKIVEQHGGELKVASSPGEGSTFSFTLKKNDHV